MACKCRFSCDKPPAPRTFATWRYQTLWYTLLGHEAAGLCPAVSSQAMCPGVSET